MGFSQYCDISQTWIFAGATMGRFDLIRCSKSTAGLLEGEYSLSIFISGSMGESWAPGESQSRSFGNGSRNTLMSRPFLRLWIRICGTTEKDRFLNASKQLNNLFCRATLVSIGRCPYYIELWHGFPDVQFCWNWTQKVEIMAVSIRNLAPKALKFTRK